VRRRQLLSCLTGIGSAWPVAVPSAQSPLGALPLPRPLASFAAGRSGSIDLAPWLQGFRPGVTQLRLRANPVVPGSKPEPFVDFESQWPEYRLIGSRLHYDGGPAAALSLGASAARMQVESSDHGFEPGTALVVSDVAVIVVEAPAGFVRHGLERWPSLRELTRDVIGNAAPGTAPSGRIDLIGQTFELTPGTFSEDPAGPPRPVATVEFPCTLRALDPRRRPVLRSTSGQRDVLQVEARSLPPLAGDVRLIDLVIRDNRVWYDSGEAGVRIKDRFAGRSVSIERCEFVRCQNAVAGGSPGQTLRITDCRIVDCGTGTQAHGIYVQPGRLEFIGNLVMHSPGARLARAHLLKSRALESLIVGNRFLMGDCPGSYLIDLPNGGRAEIGGNWLEFGPASDNSFATFIAYGAEGAGSDHGGRLYAPGRRFALVVRNNTLVSHFPGPTHFVALHHHLQPHADGDSVSNMPQPFVIADNVAWRRGPGAWVLLRDRTRGTSRADDVSGLHAGRNALLDEAPVWARPSAKHATQPNRLGGYRSRQFTGDTVLGSGSREHLYEHAGA
jgi:hypothetical protein